MISFTRGVHFCLCHGGVEKGTRGGIRTPNLRFLPATTRSVRKLREAIPQVRKADKPAPLLLGYAGGKMEWWHGHLAHGRVKTPKSLQDSFAQRRPLVPRRIADVART